MNVYSSGMKLRPIFILACTWALLAERAPAIDTQPPWVSIPSPQAGTTVSNVISVSVSATDNVGVASVRLKVDGADIGAPLTNAPFLCSLNAGQLPNGMHSLMAVATDTAGNSTRSPLVSITASNPPAYRLAAGPFMVEDLGSMLSANAQDRQAYFQESNETHLLLSYVADYGVSPLQLLDVNLSQGTARLTNTVLGRAGVYGVVLHTNGNIYQATSEANGVGYFAEYNPTTGATRQIAQLSDTGCQFSEIGDDGWIYIGEDVHGRVDRYNPTTDTFERLGQMDTNYAGSSQYAYTLGADSRYLYVGLGQSPWYLAIYDTQTKSSALYWATNGDAGGTVRHGTNGYWYYYRYNGGQVTWYHLTDGVPILLTNTANFPPRGLLAPAQRGNVVDGATYGYLLGYEVNLDNAYPNSSSNYASIRWRTSGATNWQSVGVSNFHLSPVTIQRVYPWKNSQILVFSAFYQPVFLWDINTHQTTVLGYPVFNLYDAVFEWGIAYFSGYTAAMLCYDPSRAWTLSGSTPNRFDTNNNPYQTSLTIGKDELYLAFGADGLVYAGSMHERDSTGGELGWYDPVTGTNGSLRTPFVDYNVNDLKPALGGTKLVYASTSTNLFVFDVATKSIERTITPVGTNVLDKVVEVSPGIMFGVTGSNIFKVNITDGSVIYSNTLPCKAFCESIVSYNRRLVLGPDGNIWMWRWYRDAVNMHSALYRINPADCSYTTILTNASYTYWGMNPMFNGGDVYFYGGQNLYRLRGVLNSVLLPPSELRVIGATGN